MPHKRAKRSVREQDKKSKGFNLPPKATELDYSAASSSAPVDDAGKRDNKKRRRADEAQASSRKRQSSSHSTAYRDDDTPRNGSRILNALSVQSAYRAKKRGDVDPSARDESKQASKKRRVESPQSSQSKQEKKGALPTILPHETLGDFNRRLEAHLRPAVQGAMKDAAAAVAAQKAEERRIKKENREKAKKEKKEAEKRKAGLDDKEDASGDEESDGDQEDVGSPAAGEDDDVSEDELPKPSVASTHKSKASDKAKPDRKQPVAASNQTHSDRPRATEFAVASQIRSVNDIAQAPPALPRLRRAPIATAAASGVASSASAAAQGSAAAPGASPFSTVGRVPLNAGMARLLAIEREKAIARYREIKEEQRVKREEEQSKAKKGPSKGRQ